MAWRQADPFVSTVGAGRILGDFQALAISLDSRRTPASQAKGSATEEVLALTADSPLSRMSEPAIQ
jgi:hypothetical protein